MRVPKTKTIAIVASVLLLAAAVRAQNAAVTRDPQALQILHQSSAAMGAAGLVQVADSVVEAAVNLPGDPPEGTVTISTKGSDRLRWDGSKNGQINTEVINRGRPARSAPNGWRSGPSANSINRRADHLPGLLLTYELAREDLSVTYVGLEDVEGQKAHRVRVARVSNLGNPADEQLTKNSELDLFVDAQTSLVVKISYVHWSETDWRRGLPMEIFYGDYRKVGVVLVPFYQRRVLNGTPISEMRLTSAAFNTGLSDAFFEVR